MNVGRAAAGGDGFTRFEKGADVDAVVDSGVDESTFFGCQKKYELPKKKK